MPHIRISSSVRQLLPATLYFDQLGYADAAKASYALFSQLKQAGTIPTHCRFQVSLPRSQRIPPCSLRLPMPSQQESSERLTGFTCQCRATVTMMLTLLHSRACNSILRRNCIWDWSTLRMEWRERGNVLPPHKSRLHPLVSPPNVVSGVVRQRQSQRSCRFTEKYRLPSLEIFPYRHRFDRCRFFGGIVVALVYLLKRRIGIRNSAATKT
jgi:hypothetical protein